VKRWPESGAVLKDAHDCHVFGVHSFCVSQFIANQNREMFMTFAFEDTAQEMGQIMLTHKVLGKIPGSQ
jgi:hypothetical protein